MDARRILLVSLIVCTALFEPAWSATNQPAEPGTRTAYFAGQPGWTGGGSTNTAPQSAPSYDRYGYPVTGSQPATGPPPSIAERVQNGVGETATSLREGGQALNQQFQTWTGAATQQPQSAGGNLRSTVQPRIGSTGASTKYSSPFAPPAPAPTTSAASSSAPRGNAAPPPWPSASTSTSSGAAPRWPDSSAAAADSADRSVLVTSPAPQTNTGWPNNVSNTGAPPPLLVPQSSTTNTIAAPIENSSSRNGRAYASDSARQATIHSPLTTSPAQSTTSSAGPANNWLNGWDTNPAAPQASIGKTGNGSSITNTDRNADVLPVQPAGNSLPESKRANDRQSADFRTDDPWPQIPQRSGSGQMDFGESSAATIASKPALTTGSNGAPQPSLPSINPPSINSPPNGPVANNVNVAGFTPTGTQLGGGVNGVARSGSAPPTNNPSQPWVPLIAAVLSLAGSLAANLFLGWSYLDARQKYQSLVRRTAETFRRTKPAAA